ncbi:hypothetical protein [Nitrobacter sp. Nb-311A]|uniref:hypothetical protein n=1 Tax=Nitrobacter sp. Nb-311A TaxID=314253 RepID=UPI000316F9BD|nr:hypothetical protein [Nitrobacter sp. Nb-311A]
MAGARRLLAGFAIASGMMLVSVHADAGWWSRAPVDFEECAASAEKSAASSEEKGKLLTACEARFAGRRKPGGGYTYYDFMQNRHFDIAGPNPTKEEQRRIDEQYAVFLKDQRRSIIAAAFFRKQQQVEQANAALEASGKADPVNIRLTPAPKRRARHLTVLPRPRPETAPHCGSDLLSVCNRSRMSAGVHDIKKALFGSFAKRSATDAHSVRAHPPAGAVRAAK